MLSWGKLAQEYNNTFVLFHNFFWIWENATKFKKKKRKENPLFLKVNEYSKIEHFFSKWNKTYVGHHFATFSDLHNDSIYKFCNQAILYLGLPFISSKTKKDKRLSTSQVSGEPTSPWVVTAWWYIICREVYHKMEFCHWNTLFLDLDSVQWSHKPSGQFWVSGQVFVAVLSVKQERWIPHWILEGWMR